MNKITGIILTISLLISCKSSEKTEMKNNSEPENEITQTKLIKSESNQTELIVQKILDLPDLQWMYHPELKERLPVKLLKTELIEKDFRLNKFGKEVRILSKQELQKEAIFDYVEIDSLIYEQNTLKFFLSYEIEGAIANGKFIKENGDWKILKYEVFEF